MCWFIALCMMFCRVEVVSWPDALHLMGQTQGADLSSLSMPSTSILQCTDGVNHVTNKSHTVAFPPFKRYCFTFIVLST